MRIVLLNDDFPPHARGGAGVVADNLARGLSSGHDVSVITTVRDAAAAGVSRQGDVMVYRLHAGYPDRWRSWLSLWNPQTVPAIEKLLGELKPEIVHAHNLHHHLSYHALALAKQAGAKVFLTAHDAMLFHYGKLSEFIDPAKPECLSLPDYRVSAREQFREYRWYYNPLRNTAIRHSLKNVDGLFAVSEALKEALEQNGIHGAEVVHNGIDAERWRLHQVETEAFVGEHGLSGRKVVLCSGRMNALKGLDKLLETMTIIKRSVPEAVLVVGGGKEFGRRPAAAAEDAVFTDWMTPEQMRAAIHASALVAVPSLYLDPFPTTTLEAMACGRPVVSGCFGGSKEAVVDGLTGYVIDPFDVGMMASRIIELLKNAELSAQMGEAGLARIRADFSLRRQVEATIHRYRNVSGDKRAR